MRVRRIVDASLLSLSAVAVLAICVYTLYAIWPLLNLRADLLMWSETDMVGNMIKLETGQPIFGPPEDSNSEVYTPGSSLLTYHALKLTGQPITVPRMRFVQLAMVTLAALLATHSAWRLARLAGVRRPPRPAWLWHLTCGGLIWLAATSPRVNKHVLALHTDAAVLFVSILAFSLALRYLEAPSRSRLAMLALIPGGGFFVKQLLAAWAPALTLLLAAREPSNWRRWGGYAVVSLLGVVTVVGICYAVWGAPFLFWTFEVVGGERSRISLVGVGNLALLRSADHLLRAWTELGPGVAGAILLLRHGRARRLRPLWLAWLVLVAFQALISGTGFGALYYFGPSVVIGLCWLLAGLATLWQRDSSGGGGPGAVPHVAGVLSSRLRLAVALVAIPLALQVVPSRDPAAPRFVSSNRGQADLERYVAAIESEARAVEPSRLLIQSGSWLYLPHRVLAKDRAVSLADQPLAGLYGNFDSLLQRIRSQYYAKILVLDFHEPGFLYDWHGWPRPSGVRAALVEHYREARVIPAPAGGGRPIPGVALARPVSVLVPKVDH